MRSERRRALGDHDSGAVAVETALVATLLLILIFGIVESSFLFKDWLTVSAAARAGARMGSSEPRATGLTLPRAFADDSAAQVTNAMSGLDPANLQEVWVYQAAYATGLPVSGASCTANCVKYNWPTGATKLTYLSGSWPATSQNACAGDPNRDAIGVYVKYKHTSPLGFFFKNFMVSESAVMWIEPTSAAVCK